MFSRANQRRAFRLIGALIAYTLMLVIYLVASWVGVSTAWIIASAAAQLLAGLYLITAFALFYLQTDELQRRVQGEALVFAFLGTALLACVYAFLQILGLPAVSWVYIFPIMVVLWSAGMYLAERRLD